jgi:hypothetical protein
MLFSPGRDARLFKAFSPGKSGGQGNAKEEIAAYTRGERAPL